MGLSNAVSDRQLIGKTVDDVMKQRHRRFVHRQQHQLHSRLTSQHQPTRKQTRPHHSLYIPHVAGISLRISISRTTETSYQSKINASIKQQVVVHAQQTSPTTTAYQYSLVYTHYNNNI